MSYETIRERLDRGGIVLLDGGTGSELERRGIPMDPGAWCGPASLENGEMLRRIHGDYLAAGADVITANTYASSRLMLESAGFGDRFEAINRTAIRAAHQAREDSGRDDVLVAGSLSHMCPMIAGTARADLARTAPEGRMTRAFGELAGLLRDEGCDLIALEMMYDPDRMVPAFRAAADSGLPVWAGFSARRAEDGRILGFDPDREIPFEELVRILDDFDVAAAGVMHTPSHVVSDSLRILREHFDGPFTAYPDSGYFRMPHWQFENVIQPDALADFARGWIDEGVQVVGGCCGLAPEHIAALAPLRNRQGK